MVGCVPASERDSSWKFQLKGRQKQDEESEQIFIDPMDYREDIGSGEKLTDFLVDLQNEIAVVVWYINDYGHWYVNRINHEVRGALMNIISQNYPDVIYHEVDMSEYNLNSPTYEDLAYDIGIDIKMLYDSPIVLIVDGESGEAYTSDKGSMALVKMVDMYLQKAEYHQFGVDSELSDLDNVIYQVSRFPVPSVIELEEQYKTIHSHKNAKKDSHPKNQEIPKPEIPHQQNPINTFKEDHKTPSPPSPSPPLQSQPPVSTSPSPSEDPDLISLELYSPPFAPSYSYTPLAAAPPPPPPAHPTLPPYTQQFQIPSGTTQKSEMVQNPVNSQKNKYQEEGEGMPPRNTYTYPPESDPESSPVITTNPEDTIFRDPTEDFYW
ncbi:unnamed protein product [Moneuplotes crassus]|uniref:Uncharacterized protein n=1 Tax=Euplotes crassus TaxID=5936 RepID=A0AAD1XC30_EUPCR|nr:unnamed protein product [Moneuplotes crassus]